MIAVLAVAWAALVYANAVPALRPAMALAAGFFRPAAGVFTGSGFLAALAAHAGALFAVAACDVMAWTTGRGMAQWIGGRARDWRLGDVPRPGRAREAAIGDHGAAFLLGSGVLGLAALGAAWTGLACPPVLFAGALVPAFGVWRAARRPGAARSVRRFAGAFAERLRGVPVPLACLAAVTTAGTLAGALAPEVILDATRYFLEIPHRILVLHRLVPMEGSPLAFTPLFPHVVALPLFALAGETAVKLLSWQAGLLVSALLLEWLGDDRRTAPLAPYAAVGWLTLLNVPILAQTAMPDLVVAAWVTFAVHAQFTRRRLVLAGVLWGGALGFKYQIGAALLACVAGEGLTGRPGALQRAVRLLVPAFAVVAVWPVRNWLEAGMPFYPLLVPAAVAASVHSPLPFFFMPARWAAARTPWTILASPFIRAASGAYWDGLVSPLLVALLPLAFTRATAPGLRLGLAGALAAWAFSFGSIGRYLYPVAPIILLEASRGTARLWRGTTVVAPVRLLLLAALAVDAAGSFGWAARLGHPADVALGRMTREAYAGELLRPSPATRAMGDRLRTFLRPASRFYLAGELRAWTWPGLALFDAEFTTSNLSRWADAAPDAARLRVAFRQRGIGWLVAYEQPVRGLGELAPGPGGWTPRSLAVYRAFLSRYAVPLGREGAPGAGYALFGLHARPGPAGHMPVPLPGVLEAR